MENTKTTKITKEEMDEKMELISMLVRQNWELCKHDKKVFLEKHTEIISKILDDIKEEDGEDWNTGAACIIAIETEMISIMLKKDEHNTESEREEK